VCQKVIVKQRKSSAANFLQVLLMLQCSSSKLMTTLMVAGAGRTRKLQDLVFMVQRKGFGAGVVSGLRACVFLQMLLDLPRERTGKWGPSSACKSLPLSSFRKHSDSPKANSPKF
jgi:hypothetical protein